MLPKQESAERKLLTYSQEAPTEPEKPAEEVKEEPTELEQEPVPDPTPEPEQQLLAMETTGDLLVFLSISFFLPDFRSFPLNLTTVLSCLHSLCRTWMRR